MKMKLALSILVILIVVAASLGATMAWFTAQDEAPENVFTAGTVMIEADETFISDQSVLDNMNPGDCVEKEFDIINKGTKGIYLRAEVTGKWELGENSPSEADLDEWLANNNVEVEAITASDDSVWQFLSWDPDNDVHESYSEEQWLTVDDGDGTEIWYKAYWYFKGDVAGEFTEADEAERTIKFKIKVCFDGPLTDNDYQGAVFTLGTAFEAIQSSNDASADLWGVEFDATNWSVVPD